MAPVAMEVTAADVPLKITGRLHFTNLFTDIGMLEDCIESEISSASTTNRSEFARFSGEMKLSTESTSLIEG